MNNLTSRILVAIVGIPALVFVILNGGVLFFGLILIISSIGLWEFYSMAEKKGAFPNKYLGILTAIVMHSLYYFWSISYTGQRYSEFISIGILTIFVATLLLTELFRAKPNALLNIALTVGGVLYVAVFFQCLLQIHTMLSLVSTVPMQGGYFVMCIFITIWLCDTAAYFVGRAIGKNKLFERISPNKTWEGAIAGALVAVGGFIGVAAWLLPTLSITHAAILGGIVGTIGQAGDLAESLLKRDAGVKDSSNILAGHGGVLDRFDSILMVSPVIYWYIYIVNLFGFSLFR